MNNVSPIIPNPKQLGRWCKVGAWSILGLGIFDVVLSFTYTWYVYMQQRLQANLLAQNGQNTSNYAFSPNLYSGFYYLAIACQAAILPIFLFIVLSIAGKIFTALDASTAPTQHETDNIVYEPLKIPATVRE